MRERVQSGGKRVCIQNHQRESLRVQSSESRESTMLAISGCCSLGASPKEIKAATAGVGLDPSTLHNLLERAVGEEMGGDATLSASAGEFEGKLPRNDVGEYLGGVLWVVQMCEFCLITW